MSGPNTSTLATALAMSGGILDWYSIGLQIINCAALVLLASGFSAKRRGKRKYWASIAVLVLLKIATNRIYTVSVFYTILKAGGVTGVVLSGEAILKMGADMLMLALWQIYALQTGFIKAFFLSLLGSSYLNIADTIMGNLLRSSLIDQEAFSGITSGEIILSDYCQKAIALLVIFFVYIWAKNHYQRNLSSPGEWLRVMIVPLFTLIAGIPLGNLLASTPHWADSLLILALMLLAGDIVSVPLVNYLEKQRDVEKNNLILCQAVKLESEHIASLERRYTQQRAQTHDFKNQLAILRDMARHNAPLEEFSAYLNSMLEIDIPGVLYINTHRTVVDIIMSEKFPVAKERGIDFQFQLDDLTDFPMPDNALVVVLTNLIDNAIEACGKIPQVSNRHIWMRMKVEKQSALLGIDNTTSEPVVIRDNMVRTTKADTLAHGYGLKNVAAMIEQSGGMWFIEYHDADKKFCFSASLPMKME